MMARHRLVGDDRSLGARPQRSNSLPQRRELAATDQDVVAARAERDIDEGQIAGT